MLTKTEVESLLEREPVPGSGVLSLYLDVDQSKASNLHRTFQTALEDMLRSTEAGLNGAELQHFAADAARAQDYVRGLDPSGKGVIIFVDASEDVFQAHEVRVAVRNMARWSETPYVKPLLALMDNHERFGVVLADRERGRLFTVFMGEIAEHEDFLASLPVRRAKSPGMDRILSENRLRNKAATHAHLHLKHVAESLDRLVDQYGFDRILIGGPVEATSELQQLLSKRVRSRFLTRLSLPVTSSVSAVLEEAVRVRGLLEQQMEDQIVDDLMAGHNGQTLGLEPTMHALCEERILRLVYARDFTPEGGECSNCKMLFPLTDGACKYCGAAIRRVEDLLERLVERALEQDSRLEEVNGSAAARLQQAGGVGAILRF